MELEDEEKEYLVYVDFEGNLLSNDFDESNMDINIIGIDSENPVIQINGKIFEGTYDFSVGTNIFFEKDENPPPLDPLYDTCSKEMYKFYGKTNRVLKMRRMLIERNQSNTTENREKTLDELKERFKTDMSYKDALSLFLPSGSESPRQLDKKGSKRNEEEENTADENEDEMNIEN